MFFLDGADAHPTFHRYPKPAALHQEHLQHGGRLPAGRVIIPVPLCLPMDAQFPEEPEGFRNPELPKGGQDKGRVLASVICNALLFIGKITFSVPCRQNLFPGFIHML